MSWKSCSKSWIGSAWPSVLLGASPFSAALLCSRPASQAPVTGACARSLFSKRLGQREEHWFECSARSLPSSVPPPVSLAAGLAILSAILIHELLETTYKFVDQNCR